MTTKTPTLIEPLVRPGERLHGIKSWADVRRGDVLGGIRIMADDRVPRGTIEVRDSESGKLLGKIVGCE